MKSVLMRILKLFLYLIPGLIISLVLRIFFDAIYQSLHAYFGDLFPLFSPITEREKYAVYDGIMSAVTLWAAFFLTVYFSIFTDNERYEEIIAKTDGLYDVKDAIPLYKGKFILGDAIASLLLSLALTVPLPFLPEKIFTLTVSRALVMPRAVCGIIPGVTGIIFGWFIIFAILIISHIPSVLLALKGWRAKWLSSFVS